MRILSSILIIFLFACQSKTSTQKAKEDSLSITGSEKQDSNSSNQISLSDSLIGKNDSSWVQDFRNFRDAVYQKHKEKVKSYFSFPLTNSGEIWYLVNQDNYEKNDPLGTFTEKDFDKHFEKIFPKSFIKSILKIKSAELYSKGQTETIELKENDTVSYKMYASFDKKENYISLHINYNTILKEIDEVEEYSVMYNFTIMPNGRLRFNRINLAG